MPTPQPSQSATSPGQLAAVRELNLRYFDPDFSDEQRSVVDELNRRTGHPSRSPGDVISRIAARRTAAPQDFGPPQPSASVGEMTGAGLRGVGKGLLGLIPGVTGKPSGPPTGTPSDTLLRNDANAAAYGVTDDPFTWAASAIGGVMDRTAALERNQPDTLAQAAVRSVGTLVPQIEDVAAPGMAYGEENRAPTREENLRAAEGGGSLAAVAALPIALKRISAALRKVPSTAPAPAEAAAIAPRADAINRVIGDGSYINRRNIDVGRAFADAGVEIDPREIRRNPRALVDYTDRVIDRENLAADQLLQSEAAQAPAANGHVVARGPRTIALLNSADIEAARAVDDYVTRRVDELSAPHGGNGAISVADADLLKRELQNRANYDKIFGNTALTTSDNLRNQLLADTAQRFDRLGDTIPGYRELNNRRSSLIHWRDNLLDPIVDTAKTGGKRPSRVVAGARTAAAAVRGDVHGIVRGASDLTAAQVKLPTPERVARAIRSAVQGREASGPTAEILRTAAPREQMVPPQPPPANPDFAAGESGPAYTTGGRVGQTAASSPSTGPTGLATELGPPDAASAHRAQALDRTGAFRDAGIASNVAVLQRGPGRPLLGPPSGPTVQPSSGLTFEADAPGGQRGITPRSPGGRRDVVARSTRPPDIAPPPPAPHGTDLPREVLSGDQPVTFDHPVHGKVAGTVVRHFVRADGKRALIMQTPKGERMATADMVRLPKVRAGSGAAAAAPAQLVDQRVPFPLLLRPHNANGGDDPQSRHLGDLVRRGAESGRHELKQNNPGIADTSAGGHDTFGDMLFGASANAQELPPGQSELGPEDSEYGKVPENRALVLATPPSQLLPEKFKNSRQVSLAHRIKPTSGANSTFASPDGDLWPGAPPGRPSIIFGHEKSPSQVADVLPHELGHTIWTRDLSPKEQTAFIQFMRQYAASSEYDPDSEVEKAYRRTQPGYDELDAKERENKILREFFPEMVRLYIGDPSTLLKESPKGYQLMKSIFGGREYIGGRVTDAKGGR